MKLRHIITVFTAIIILISAMLIEPTYASTSKPSSITSFNGLYAGLGFGAQIPEVELENTINLFIPTVAVNNFESNPNVDHASYLINLALGYGHVFKKDYYLGVEARAGFEDMRATNDLTIQEQSSSFLLARREKVSLSNDFMLVIRPGVFLPSQTLLYGVFGAALAEISFYSNSNYSQNFGVITISALTSTTQNKYHFGFVVGLGLEKYITSNLSARLEYDYIDYGRIFSAKTTLGTVNNAPLGSIFSITNKPVKVKMNDITIGIVYHFK